MDFDLRQHVVTHNRVQALLAVGYAIGGALAWFLAYWFIWGFVWFILFQFDVDQPGRWATYGAWAYVVVLLFEGARYGKELFDLNAFVESYYNTGFTDTDQEFALRRYMAMRGITIRLERPGRSRSFYSQRRDARSMPSALSAGLFTPTPRRSPTLSGYSRICSRLASGWGWTV